MKEEKNLFKKIFKIAKPFYSAIVILLLLIILDTSMGLFGPYFFGKLIDRLIENDFSQAYKLALLTVAFWLINLVIAFANGIFEIKKIRFGFRKHFTIWSMEKILGLSLGQFRGENSGYRQRIFEKGEGAFNDVLRMLIFDALPIIISSTATAIALFFIDIRLAAIVSISLVLYVFVSIKMNRSIIPELKRFREAWGNEGREYSENLRYLGLIKANVQEKKALENYKEAFGKVSDIGIPLWIGYEKVAFWRDLIPLVARGSTLFLGIWMTINGALTVGVLVIFFTWSSTVFIGVQRLGFISRMITDSLSSIRKLFELLEEPPEVTEIEHPIRPESFNGRIRFDNVSFAYTKRKKGNPNDDDEEEVKNVTEYESPVLHNVSFSIPAGKTTAFVGRSGSGKTTMINLLLRAYDPQGGAIYIDGIDLKDLDLKYYRNHIGVVEQDVELFDKSMKYNILFSIDEYEKYEDDYLDGVSLDSGVSEFSEKLTDGYETRIGEKGVQLSGGQRQRVGIARVLAKKPKILIFDEATSSLDSVNEKKIQEAMKKALEGRTGIIIAHRLSTIIDADQIVVFEHGKVVGAGTHQELLETCEAYTELVKLQNLYS